LLLPILIVVAMLVGLVMLRRWLFREEATPAPIPLPTHPADKPAPAPRPAPPAPAGTGAAGNEGISLAPARLYPRRPLNDTQMQVFSQLLKALPGYVVLPKISYNHFLEARDGSASENTSLHNRSARHTADFLVCDKKLRVLLVCQIDDGTHLPARIAERDKMLQKTGLRLLRWKVSQPPDPQALLSAVRKLEALHNPAS